MLGVGCRGQGVGYWVQVLDDADVAHPVPCSEPDNVRLKMPGSSVKGALGYLAYKKPPYPLGPPYGPRHMLL